MSKNPTSLTELLATLKGYVNQLSAGERTPGEVGSALNDWARDSAESIKARIQEEVEASVAKMGFVKREEFDALRLRFEKLEKKSTKKSTPRTTIDQASVKKRAPSTKKKAVK